MYQEFRKLIKIELYQFEPQSVEIYQIVDSVWQIWWNSKIRLPKLSKVNDLILAEMLPIFVEVTSNALLNITSNKMCISSSPAYLQNVFLATDFCAQGHRGRVCLLEGLVEARTELRDIWAVLIAPEDPWGEGGSNIGIPA